MKTLIIMILDESGSMGNRKEDVIKGYNKFINDQKDINDDIARFHLVKFNTTVSTVYSGVPIAKVPELSTLNYTPGGNTALYDSISVAVRVADNIKNEDERVICVIITDGEENSSLETTKNQVENIISSHVDRGDWTFLYLGENPGKWTKNTGISSSHGISYDNDNPVRSFDVVDSAIGRFRKGKETQVKSGLFDSPPIDSVNKFDSNNV